MRGSQRLAIPSKFPYGRIVDIVAFAAHTRSGGHDGLNWRDEEVAGIVSELLNARRDGKRVVGGIIDGCHLVGSMVVDAPPKSG